MSNDSRFCEGCGTALEPGVRFCEACGRPAAEEPAQTLSAQPAIGQLTWSSAAAGAGLIMAVVSTFLPWLTDIGSLNRSVGPYGSGFWFRISRQFPDEPTIDGPLVIVIAVAGLLLLAAHLKGRLPSFLVRYAFTAVGLLLVAIATIEMQYLNSATSGSIGPGLYLLFLGGALTAASPWIPAGGLKSQ